MTVRVRCPNAACGRTADVPEEYRGSTLRCKHCGHRFPFSAGGDADLASHTPQQGAKETIPPAESKAASPGLSPAPASPAAAADLPGQIGRFQVRALLGAGAFGVVYRAFDPTLERDVALKVPQEAMLDNPRLVQRFLREAKAAARLRHPHIVPVYEVGQDGLRPYIASAFIEGQTLSQAIDAGTLDCRQAAQIVHDLAEALEHAHEEGIIHRDVKSANVMLDTRGRAYLMDFGLAHLQEATPRQTRVGAVVGTPAYLAPEQAGGWTGQALPASDQYSLGVVLYELLCGQPPFGGPPDVVLYNAVHHEPPAPRRVRPEVPAELERICLKALAKRPEQRHAGCQEMAGELRRWLAGGPIPAPQPGLVEKVRRWCREHPAVVVSAVTAAACLLGIGLVLVIPRRGPTETEVSAGEQAGQTEPPAEAERPALEARQPPAKPPGPEARPAPPAKPPPVKVALPTVEIVRAEPARLVAGDGLTVHLRGTDPDGGALRYSYRTSADGKWLDAADDRVVLPKLPAGPLWLEVRASNLQGSHSVPVSGTWTVLERPEPLDSRKRDVGAAEIKRVRQAWAKYLGRGEEEEIDLGGGVKLKLVLIPPGKFLMGSPEDEKDREENEELHEVEITRPFYLGAYEVTQEQYEKVKGKNPSWFSAAGGGRIKVKDLDTSRFPVENVYWEEAVSFCDKLTLWEDVGLRVRGQKFRLPTEAEWEYACRGGAGASRPFHFGAAISTSEANCRSGGADRGRDLGRTTTVGSYAANHFGLYDMHGNVCEWCADSFGKYDPGKRTDPAGPARGENKERRVLRGGYWGDEGRDCRAAARRWGEPGYRDYSHCGFRVVLGVGARP
jgi:formylglycine-generating enzyme required for sulfatase activity